jgi:sporulation protein YlmC with PRC-barrel domain
MKNKIFTTVSAVALISASPVFAETTRTQTQTEAETSTSGNITSDAKEAWKDIKSDASDAYEEIKATLIGDEQTDKNGSIVIETRKTANGIIGNPVYNEKQERVAKVTDIILDKDGKAMMVVVADGSFIGTGKKAAFDYNAITRVEKDGDVIMPLTENIINSAATFSYDMKDSAERVRVIPSNGYSVAKLLGGNLVNQKKEVVADIENISFKNGSASQLIVGFDKILGMGGEKVVFSYNDAAIIHDGEKLDFQLSTKKSAQFEAYKKSAIN